MKKIAISTTTIGLIIILSVVVVYAPVGDFAFLNFDDDVYVTGNVRVRTGLTWDNLRWAFVSTDAGFWQPLTWLSLMLDHELYGLNAGGYHITNVLIHIAAALFLFFALHELTGAKMKSAAVAFLFAVHPLHVESVAWVGDRKDVLCGLFWMLAMFAYARYAQSPSRLRYMGVMACFLGALMSKAMAVTLPLVLLLLDYWPLCRFGVITASVKGVDGRMPILWEKIPMLAVSVALTVITFYAEEKTGALKDFTFYPWDVRLANAFVAYVTYLVKTIWPFDLAIYYPHPGRILVFPALTALMTLAGTTYLIVHYRRKAPYAFTGWLWYLGTLLPVIGLVQIGGHAMADRYTYIPLTGIFILAVWGGYDLAVFLRMPRRWLLPLTVAVAFFLIVISA
ncbi:MAG: hypothetical protein N2Z74_09025, partial [Syntrophales bacterium]|nr:hypothetical protein [Syntrophales bacterium]